MYATNYAKASSIEDAVAKVSGGDDAKFLSGGQTLIATMKQRLAAPSDVIDVTKIPELQGITVSADEVSIGAATTHAAVAEHSGIKETLPALAALAGGIGDPAVRHMGTIGGVIANNDPSADYPAACMALDATIHTSKGTYSAADYFTGMFDTALDEDELVTRVVFKVPQKAAYEKFRNQASRYAMCGVMVALGKSGEARVAVTGAGSDGVFRVSEMEAALSQSFAPEAVASIAVDPDMMLSDIHGSAEYRAHLVPVLASRAVIKANG